MPWGKAIGCILLLGVLLGTVWGCRLVKAAEEIFDTDEPFVSQKSIYDGKSGETLDYVIKQLENEKLDLDSFFSDLIVVFSKSSVTPATVKKCVDEDMFTVDEGIRTNLDKTGSSEDSYTYSEVYTPPTLESFPDINIIKISTKARPHHPSNYFLNNAFSEVCGKTFGDGSTINKQDLNYTYIFPIKTEVTFPTEITHPQIIGIAINGVPLMATKTMDSIKNSLDAEFGKPNSKGGYHYHAAPPSLIKDKTKLIGIALDGFPIYGPHEQNTSHVPADLDRCRGHIGFADKLFGTVYHYHVKPFSLTKKDTSDLFIGCFSGLR